jgi:pimeloyl-ACP methyl ester carboxylesterase
LIVYLHGFASGPGSTKARAIAGRFAGQGVPVAVPDLTPGADGFERSTPTSMLAVAEEALAASPGPHGVIGSSLGGWLAALAASRLPAVERLVLLAPAFRLHERWSARAGARGLAQWRDAGSTEVFHHATARNRRIGWAFFEDAARWPAFPEVKVPTLVLTGRRDDTVPLEDVEAWVARTPAARLVVVDDGHELTASLDRIWEEARAFLRPLTGA